MIVYEAAILRYRPDAFAGEFVNVGLFMVIRDEAARVLEIMGRVHRSSHRLSTFFADLWDVESYSMWRNSLTARINAVAARAKKDVLYHKEHGYFEKLCDEIQADTRGIFSWSTRINGTEENADRAFEVLMDEMVTRHIKHPHPKALSERELWEETLPMIQEHLGPVTDRHGLIEFDAAITDDSSDRVHMRWRNGVDQFLEPLSFQVVEADTVNEKGQRMTGRLFQLTKQFHRDFRCSILLAPPTDTKLQKSATRQLDMIRQTGVVGDILGVEQLPAFLARVRAEAKPLQ